MPHTETYINGVRYPSVTEISSIAMGGDWLLKYYAKNGLAKANAILEALSLRRDQIPITPEIVAKYRLTVDDFWKDAEVMKTEAAERGSNKHEVFEAAMGAFMGKGDFPTDPYTVALRSWVVTRGLTPLAFEKKVITEKHGFGGTFDALFKTTGGREVVVDWKFTNRLKSNYILQLAGYDLALGGPKRSGYILRLAEHVKDAKATAIKPSANGTMFVFEGSKVFLEEMFVEDLSKHHETFLACKKVLEFLRAN